MTPKELSNQLRDEAIRSATAIRLIADQVEAMNPMPGLNVPYRSQWDADAALFKSDCGPACLAMLLAYRGIHATIDSLSIACGLSATKKTTTGANLARASQQRSLKLEIVTGWTLDQFAQHLPAIALIHYGSLPNRLDTNSTAGHWVVVTAIDNRMVTFHDPDWWPTRRDEGANRIVQRGIFVQAILDCDLDNNPVGYGLVLSNG